MLLLLLLSRFSCVRLCAMHEGPLKAGKDERTRRLEKRKDNGRQESSVSPGVHFRGSFLMSFQTLYESELAQSCPTLCDPMGCFSIKGIFQARVLEWVAISLLQGIFPTQGSNPGLPHCRRTLYPLSHQGSPQTLYTCMT